MVDNLNKSDNLRLKATYKELTYSTIYYFFNKNCEVQKENKNIFSSRKILQSDNYLKLRRSGIKRIKSKIDFQQNKGKSQYFKEIINIAFSVSPITENEITETQKLIENIRGI